MECQPVATIPEVLAKVDLFQAFRTLFLLVYKVANSVYYAQGGRGWMPPLRFFWVFSWRIKHQHLMFSVAVRSSLARILSQVQWWSVSMVTRYDVISRKWSGHFSVKVQFFSTFFNNKSKSCGLNHAKCLFMCYFSSEAKKVAIFRGFNRFLILSKIQDSGQGGDHCWWRHRPPAAPPPIKYTFIL